MNGLGAGRNTRPKTDSLGPGQVDGLGGAGDLRRMALGLGSWSAELVPGGWSAQLEDRQVSRRCQGIRRLLKHRNK